MKGVFRWWLCALLWLPWVASADTWDQVDSRLRQQINRTGGPLTDAPLSVIEMEKVWQGLEQLSTAELLRLGRQANNNYFEQGWFELAQTYRLASVGERAQRLEQWRQRWFHHPAVNWLGHLQQRPAVTTARAPFSEVRQLAALLPLSGDFAAQGREVLAGMRAALDWDRRQGYSVPELQVFDTQTVDDLPELLNELARGHPPDLVVGPLQVAQTRQLAGAQPLPVLALNRVESPGFNGYQLDLATDQELRQLIDRLQADGHRRVLLLAPEAEAWVEPLLVWIDQLAEARGVGLQARLRYASDPARLDEQLAQVLGVAASDRRAQQLSTRLEQPPKFEARRRQDLDAVLLIARPEQARLVKPVLNFHQASNLPVYAGSHLYSGRPDPLQDRDLEGIVFCDMPWRLRQRPGREAAGSFFALGMDAGSVYRALPAMQAGRPGYFEGETGNLRLLGGARLQRELPCARFRRGVPVVLE